MSDNRNDLPPVNSPNFLEKVREAISTYLGTRGDPLNRGLTVRDLADAGVIGLNPRYGGSGGRVNPVGGVGNAVTDVTLAVDLTPPPTPEGFAASAAFENIMVSVNAQTYTQGHGHGRTRLYGSTIAGTTFGDADLLMEFSGTVASYPATMGTTYYLWATNVSKDGVESVLPAPIGDVYGISVTTAPNIPDLLDALAGEITSSELSSDLNTRINLIDAAGTGLVPRMTATESRLADIDTTLADVINTPAYNPATTYAVGDMVQYEGALYRAILETTGNLPTDTVYWVKVADYTSLADAVAGHSVDLVVQAGYIGEIEYQDAIDRITVLGNKVIQKGDHIVALQQIGDNVAAITLEQGARVTDTGAIASKTEGMYTAFAGNTAAIVLERTTSATNEAAAASLTQTLYSAMGDSKAGLVTSYDTQATVNSALSSKVEVLKAETADGRAKLATEQTVRIDETAALAASATVLGSVFGAQKTALLETSSTLSTATEAVANKLLALNAVAGANAAGLIVERQTSATEVSAVASQLTALSSTVAGNQATLTNDYYTKADTKGAIASAQTTLRAFRPPSRVWKSDTQPTQGSTNVLLADGTSYAEPTLTVGDMWIDYADQNKSYQWDGTTWISARDTNPSALITNLEQTKIGYATKDGVVFDNGGLITNKTEMDAWNAANGGTDAVWHVGLPLAYAVKQVGVTTSARAVYRGTNPAFTATTEAGVTAWNTANPLDKAVWIPAETGTIESRTQALQDETGKLKLSYTIKLDNNGMMSGYGLYSEGATSQFIANVNQFAVTLPSTSIPDWAAGAKALGAIAKISGDTTSGKYLVCVKAGTSSSTAPSIAGLIGTIVTDGSVEWQIASRVPFAVVSAPTTIEGVPLPAGGYFDGAYIRNLNANFITAGTINGDIVNVTKALTAADVTAGAIWTGDVTSTSNTVIEGVSYPSFSINASTGLATFNNAVVRGTVYATAGEFRGVDVKDSAGNVILSAGSSLAAQMASRMGGGNMVPNSDLSGGAGNWAVTWNQGGGTNYSFGVDVGGVEWSPAGGHSVSVVRTGETGAASGVFDIRPAKTIPARPNTRYELSAYLSAHRCPAGFSIMVLDSAGSYITEMYYANTAEDSGGKDLNNWGRPGGFYTTPANATQFHIGLRAGAATAADPYAWMTRMFIAEAGANQTVLSPWSAGGSSGQFGELDKLTSANVSTYIASAAIGEAYIGDLNASKITAGTIAADRLDSGTVTAKVANLSAAVITSGTIGSARIGDASIGTLKLGENSATICKSQSGTSGYVDVVFTIGYAADVLVVGSGVNSSAYNFGLQMNGSWITGVELAQGLITMSAKVTLAAGTHTASVRCDGRSGTISIFASIR